jgi:hypothetical protein
MKRLIAAILLGLAVVGCDSSSTAATTTTECQQRVDVPRALHAVDDTLQGVETSLDDANRDLGSAIEYFQRG